MASKRSTHSVNIPIKVVAQPVMATMPPIQPVIAPKKSRPRSIPKPTLPSVNIAATPEHVRRRIMWSVVLILMVVIVGGWLAILRGSFSSGGSGLDLVWGKVRTAFTGFSLAPKKVSAGEQEIRQLDSQVFPELSK